MNLKKFFIYRKRIKYLINKGWYLNIVGGITDGHCVRIISKKDLAQMSEEEFEEISL